MKFRHSKVKAATGSSILDNPHEYEGTGDHLNPLLSDIVDDAAEIGVIRAFLEQYRQTPIKALYARAYLRISAVSAALGGQYQVTTRADHRDAPTRVPLSCTPHPTRWLLNAF